MRRCIFLWSLQLFVCVHLLLAETRTTDTIGEIADVVDEETLVIFDIDKTLIYYPQMILSPRGFPVVVQTFVDKFNVGVPRESIGRWWGEIFLHCSPLLIEEETQEMFENFAQRGILCLGLTKRPWTPLGSIKDSGDFLLESLGRLHIGFTFHKNHTAPLSLEGEASSDMPPVFKKGCIFAAGQEKGPILGKLFEKLEHTPKKVVFVDDKFSNVESVATELDTRGIANVCFHYLGINALDIPYDQEIVVMQVNHLIENDAWLPEEDAQSYVTRRWQ